MITVRAMQVKDAEQVSELERMIFSQPWSYQGFVDSLSLPNTVFLLYTPEIPAHHPLKK